MTWRYWLSLVTAFLITVIPHMVVAFVMAPVNLWRALYEQAQKEVHQDRMQRVFVLRNCDSNGIDFPKDKWRN